MLLNPFFLWVFEMNKKIDHIKAALMLADCLKDEPNVAVKKIFAKAIIENLKAFLKQEK